MSIRRLLHKFLPQKITRFIQKQKKNRLNKKLRQDSINGETITYQKLISDLKLCGIEKGDSVLVHSSMSKIGFLENGPNTFIEALFFVVSENGNILMPSSPNAKLQLDYIRQNTVFDVKKTPSKLGAITEVFRKMNGVERSLHPTEPVCAWGKDAKFLTEGHFLNITPYNQNSPFGRLIQLNGKILYIGVTLSNAGTSLHTLEDSVNFKYPVYYDEVFEVTVIDREKKSHKVKTKVHNPEFSKKRKCDDLIPIFLEEGVCKKVFIGNAESYIFDAKKMFDCMVSNYNEKGITMYTPNGSE